MDASLDFWKKKFNRQDENHKWLSTKIVCPVFTVPSAQRLKTGIT